MTAWLWVAFACRPEDDAIVGPGAPLAPTFAGLEAVSALGGVPFAAPLRRVNDLGAAMTGDDLAIQVDGAAATFADDGTGYGVVDLVAPGSADILYEGAVVTRIHATAADWSPGAWPASPAPALGLAAAPATRGAFVATADAVWWTASADDPLPLHAVLRPGVPIDGLRSGNIDNDGVIDVVAWGADQVWWLRGRIGGGATWGGGWQVLGARAVGADVGDVDLDGANDLTLVWANTPDGHALDVRLGDNAGGFLAARTIPLSVTPRTVGVGANGTQGEVQVTVLDDTNAWARYVWTDDVLLATGPNLVDLSFEAGTRVDPAWDTNGDGADELVFVGPRVADDAEVSIELYDLVQDDGRVTYTPFEELGARVALADVDANGMAELILVTGDGAVVNSRWNGASYQQSTGARLSDLGEIALSDLDGDRTVDLTMTGSFGWASWQGSVAVTDGLATWSTGAPSASPALEGLGDVGEVGVRLGRPTLVAFAPTNTRLQRISGAAGVSYDVATLLDGLGGSKGLDVAVCGGVAFALTDAALGRVGLDSGAAVSVPWVGGKKVACDEDNVWVLGGGELAKLDGVTLEAAGAPVASAGRDVAITDAGPTTCDTDGCEIVAWTFATDGATVGVTQGPGRATAALGPDRLDLPAGRLSVGDVDGDGLADLLVTSADAIGTQISVARATGEGFGPAVASHALGGGRGPAVLLDAGADGTADLHVFVNGTLYRWPR